MTDEAHTEEAADLDAPAPGGTYPDPAGFPDGDQIDSTTVEEPEDGYREPADPDAEPVEDDAEGGVA